MKNRVNKNRKPPGQGPIKSQQEADNTMSWLVDETVKTLGISKEQAELRVSALLQSKVLDKFGKPEEDGRLFEFVVDICMQIPQLFPEVEEELSQFNTALEACLLTKPSRA